MISDPESIKMLIESQVVKKDPNSDNPEVKKKTTEKIKDKLFGSLYKS